MNEETILNFIKNGESETVEFKSTLDQAAIETIAAFANTKGGYVFGCGINFLWQSPEIRCINYYQ
jgi:predicted HTH transcriptional regulator